MDEDCEKHLELLAKFWHAQNPRELGRFSGYTMYHIRQIEGDEFVLADDPDWGILAYVKMRPSGLGIPPTYLYQLEQARYPDIYIRPGSETHAEGFLEHIILWKALSLYHVITEDFRSPPQKELWTNLVDRARHNSGLFVYAFDRRAVKGFPQQPYLWVDDFTKKENDINSLWEDENPENRNRVLLISDVGLLSGY